MQHLTGFGGRGETKGGINPMKQARKVLIHALAILLVAAMFPTGAFATNEPADMSAINIKGVSLPLGTLYDTAEAARANTYELALTLEQLANTSTPISITDPSGADANAKIYSPGSDSAVTGAFSGLTGAITNDATSTASLTPGTVIWLIDGNGAGAIKGARILINQKADGSIPGTGTVKNPVYNVALPTNIDFALNPLQIGKVSTGNQITSADYSILNKSDAPMNVSFNLTAALDSGDSVTLVDNPSALKKDDITEDTKKLYFGALSAHDGSTISYSGGSSSGSYEYDATKSDTLIPFDATDNEAKIDFLLAAGNGTQVVDGSKGVASFQFYAELNTYAHWDSDDISVTGAYTFTGVRGDDYTALTDSTTGKIATDSLNLLAAGPKADVTIAANATETKTFTIAQVAGGITIALRGKPASVTSVVSTTASYTFQSSNYSYDSTTGVLTFHYPYTGPIAFNMAITAGGGSVYTLALTVQ
jgi:hypothetical protein